MIKEFINSISSLVGIDNSYLFPVFYTIITIILIRLSVKVIVFIFNKIYHNEEKLYSINKNIKAFFNILLFLIIFLIWEHHIQNIMYLISFVSAGIALSLKEVILNYVSGLYIKMKKPFKVEDRIVIGEIEGDVVDISSTNFEILEVSDKEEGEQSTGVIVHIPNSTIFTSPLKNYTKVFKYVWNELTVSVPMDADLKQSKAELYRIINTNEIVKRIPRKMKNEIDNAVANYRIYYNKLEPIIYTKVVDTHIELSVRYLVHPKKARNVESEFWNKVLDSVNKGDLVLYKEVK